MNESEPNAIERIARSPEPIKVALFLVPDFPLLTFSAALDPLRQANRIAGRQAYKWILVSEDGAPVLNSAMVPIGVDCAMADLPRCDLVIVCAGLDHRRFYRKAVLDWLRNLNRRSCVIGAISTGTFLLAKAGLLDGRRCAVHWEHLAAFQEEFPKCSATNDIFAVDGRFITSSGGTVTLDMMLYIIAACSGRNLASAISDQFNHPEIRQQGVAQRLPAHERFGIRNQTVAEIIKVMEQSIQHPVDLQVLARRVQLSTRQIERLFVQHLGKTPSAFYAGLRMSRANDLILQTDLPIAEVAQICGYMSSTRFGRLYRAHFGLTPHEVRRNGIASRKDA